MTNYMVVERSPHWTVKTENPEEVLRDVYRQYYFLDKRDVAKSKARILIVSAKANRARAKPQPVDSKDFLANTLNPLRSKAKTLFSGRSAYLARVEVTKKHLIFVFSTGSELKQ